MKSDWRLTNQMNYLYKATLKKAVFRKAKANDHEHCEFCWGKFGADEDQFQYGYSTLDGYHWICNICFKDFKDQFEWRIQE